MKIFISWSGEKSFSVATALKNWLLDVFQQIEVWISAHNIEAGARWNTELDKILEESCFGIICLTPENLSAPWLLFEAGALGKVATTSRVIPYRIGLAVTDVKYPLAQFQSVSADREGTLSLIKSINSAYNCPISNEKLTRIFDKWWPDLEMILNDLPSDRLQTSTIRSDRELLSEILELVRNISRHGEKAQTDQIIDRKCLYDMQSIRDYSVRDTIEIDSKPLFGMKGIVCQLKYDSQETISDFLDRVFFLLKKMGKIQPYTYGQHWMLEDEFSGKRYDDIGREYCKSRGKNRDDRLISSTDITSGSRLLAIPLGAGK